jgi:hypothetical protein
MEKQYGHHVAASLPAESDTGASAKAIMDEGALPAYTLEQVRAFPPAHMQPALSPPLSLS